jgi:hypothetical protein
MAAATVHCPAAAALLLTIYDTMCTPEVPTAGSRNASYMLTPAVYYYTAAAAAAAVGGL